MTIFYIGKFFKKQFNKIRKELPPNCCPLCENNMDNAIYERNITVSRCYYKICKKSFFLLLYINKAIFVKMSKRVKKSGDEYDLAINKLKNVCKAIT